MLFPDYTAPLDIRGIAQPDREQAVFDAFRLLRLGDAIEVTCDQDPRPLYTTFQREAGGNFAWRCIGTGPRFWRICIMRVGVQHGAGECCGSCGGLGCA